ncbi:MAG: zinc ribbon domain-containing protein [Oscillospiraceae bacterium]|nr:zinc ribbon domain-containing protein [Oscillospiraceae bacterium]
MKNKTDFFGGSKNLRIWFEIAQWALVVSIVPALVRMISWIAAETSIAELLFWLAPSTIVVALETAAVISIRYKLNQWITYAFLTAAAAMLLIVTVIKITDSKYDLAEVRSYIFGFITEASIIISIFLVTKRNIMPLFWIFCAIGFAPHLISPFVQSWYSRDVLSYILLAICTTMLFLISTVCGICPKCGFKNVKKANFCSGCGEKM